MEAGRTTMSKTGCRNNCAQDADAIAHGMCKRMGAGPAPAAWGSAPASGQGQQVCQKRRIDTIVLGMETQLRMGCATRWRQSAWDAQRHYMGQGKNYASSRFQIQPYSGCRCNCAWDAQPDERTCDVQRHRGKAKTMPTAGCRYNRAPDADAIAHGMSNRAGQGQHLPHGDAQLHRGKANNCAKNGLQKQPCPGCRCKCAWDAQPRGGRAGTCRMEGRACIRAGLATMPKTAYRHNCADAIAHGMCNRVGQGQHLPHGDAQLRRGKANNYTKNDADAIAHGMRNRMGARPAPPAWGARLYEGRASNHAKNGI